MRAIWAPPSRRHCAPLRCARKRATLGYERTRDGSGTHTQPCRRLRSNGLLMTKYFSKADISLLLFASPIHAKFLSLRKLRKALWQRAFNSYGLEIHPHDFEKTQNTLSGFNGDPTVVREFKP